MEESLPVWRLAVCTNKSFGLRPTNLEYFTEYFCGKPLPPNWTPPPFVEKGKSYKIKDFVSWMLSAPVVSERAYEALWPTLAGHTEFRCMGYFKNKKYYALNVLTTADCIDLDGSDVLFAPDDPKYILSIHSYKFRTCSIPKAPIFKVSDFPLDIFVTHSFIDCVRKHKLSGAAFLDPSVNPFHFILHQDGDYVDGLVGFNFFNPNHGIHRTEI